MKTKLIRKNRASFIRNKLNNLDWKNLIIVFIFLIGLGFRLWLVFSKAFWLDEVLYFSVAKNFSINNILGMNNWMKNVPPFYLIFVKIWSHISTNRVWLRMPGVITYVVSFGILSNFFHRKNYYVRLVVLWMYSLSIYFAHIQSWLSPFNIVVMWGLVMYLLMKLFIEGYFDNNLVKFFFLTTIVHWLLISTHYSAVYFILGYIAFFIFIRKNLPQKQKACLLSMAAALLVSIPTVVRFFQYMDTYSGENEMLFDIGKPLALYSNLIFNSVFRYINKVCVMVAIFCGFILFLNTDKKEKNKLNVILATILLVGSYGFLYFISPHFKSFVVERSVFIFHLGFYFFYDAVFGLKKFKKSIYYLVFLMFMVFPIISFGQYFNGLEIDYFPGDVTSMVYSQGGYDDFLKKVKSSVDSSLDGKIYVTKNINQVNYDFEVFWQYYLKNSSVIEGIEFELINSDSNIAKELSSPNIIFLRNSELEDDAQNNSALEKYNSNVINFYDYVYE